MTDHQRTGERTLANYRPQHDDDCARWKCGVCGYNSTDCYYNQNHPKREEYRQAKHEHITQPCSCGLDALLAKQRTGEQTVKKDDQETPDEGYATTAGGLIGATWPPTPWTYMLAPPVGSGNAASPENSDATLRSAAKESSSQSDNSLTPRTALRVEQEALDTTEVTDAVIEVQELRAQLADAEQQLKLLRPGGTYAWKERAEKAEAKLAALETIQ